MAANSEEAVGGGNGQHAPLKHQGWWSTRCVDNGMQLLRDRKVSDEKLIYRIAEST